MADLSLLSTEDNYTAWLHLELFQPAGEPLKDSAALVVRPALRMRLPGWPVVALVAALSAANVSAELDLPVPTIRFQSTVGLSAARANV